jgi:tagatose 1,6-diphosphate aldolase
MTKVKMSRGKFEGLIACSNEKGLIAAAAMDQRGSLQKSIAKCRGDGGKASSADLALFKKAVVKVLTPHASAVLIDPEYGLEALAEKAPGTGVVMMRRLKAVCLM